MRGNQTNEIDVGFPASDVWNVYSTLILPHIMRNIPNVFEDLKVAGDGSVGTTFDAYLLPGAPFSWYKAEIVTLDHEHRVREVKTREGGLLSLGFISFMARFEIIEKGANLTTIRNSCIYEINDADSANEAATSVSLLITIAKAVVDHLQKNAASSTAN